jgi:hypothetical protein
MRFWRKLREAGAGGWLPDYLLGQLQAERATREITVHLLFMFADHWEPAAGEVPDAVADGRTRDWLTLYPRAAAGHADADGRKPQHSFFYPYDQYRRHDIEALAELSNGGCGEVELHLHHRDDTSASLTRKLDDAVGLFRQSGCLGTGPDGRPSFGFVHGDWALDNSRRENGHNFCGVNDELRVLRRAGCFADFTFPAFGCQAQPRWVNRILRVTDDPCRPKSYDRGETVRVRPVRERLNTPTPNTQHPTRDTQHPTRDTQHPTPRGDLILLPGPLVLHRSGGGPRLDDGQVTGVNVPRADRTDSWVKANVHVLGRPEWVFVKVHSHGCTDRNRLPLLTRELDRLWTDLETRYNDGERYRLHYVSAREAYNVLRAAEDGRTGDPGQYRDYEIAPPPCRMGASPILSERLEAVR